MASTATAGLKARLTAGLIARIHARIRLRLLTGIIAGVIAWILVGLIARVLAWVVARICTRLVTAVSALAAAAFTAISRWAVSLGAQPLCETTRAQIVCDGMVASRVTFVLRANSLSVIAIGAWAEPLRIARRAKFVRTVTTAIGTTVAAIVAVGRTRIVARIGSTGVFTGVVTGVITGIVATTVAAA